MTIYSQPSTDSVVTAAPPSGMGAVQAVKFLPSGGHPQANSAVYSPLVVCLPSIPYVMKMTTAVIPGFTGRITMEVQWFDATQTLISGANSDLHGDDYRTSAAGGSVPIIKTFTGTANCPTNAVYAQTLLICEWSSTVNSTQPGYVGLTTVNAFSLGSTQNQTFISTTDPALTQTVYDGAFWFNPSTGLQYNRQGGSWIPVSGTIADMTVVTDTTTAGSGSYNVPLNHPPYMQIEIWGAGGMGNFAGGKGGAFYGASGAGYVKHHISVTPGTTVINWIVGAASNSPGANGGNTTVSALSLTATGGIGATTSAAATTVGTGSGGNLANTSGRPGGTPNTYTGGGAGNGGGDQTASNSPGTSPGGGSSGSSTSAVPGPGRIVLTARTS